MLCELDDNKPIFFETYTFHCYFKGRPIPEASLKALNLCSLLALYFTWWSVAAPTTSDTSELWWSKNGLSFCFFFTFFSPLVLQLRAGSQSEYSVSGGVNALCLGGGRGRERVSAREEEHYVCRNEWIHGSIMWPHRIPTQHNPLSHTHRHTGAHTPLIVPISYITSHHQRAPFFSFFPQSSLVGTPTSTIWR